MISLVITTSPVNVVDCEGFGEEYKRENNTDCFPGFIENMSYERI